VKISDQRRWFTAAACILLYACATVDSSRNEITVYPAVAKRGSYRVDVYGTPMAYKQVQADSSLSPAKRIAALMHTIADAELKDRGLCPNGVVGPDNVLGFDNDWTHQYFFVSCVP